MIRTARHRSGLGCIFAAGMLFSAATAAGVGRTDFPIRDIQAVGETLWAVGDGGGVLLSRDGGETFQPLAHSVDPAFHIQALRQDGPSICLLGGKVAAGFPGGGAVGTILRSDDAGETFEEIPAGSLGWLFDGVVGNDSVLAVGQAVPSGPTGAYHTVDGGAHWRPLALRGRGWLRAAAFEGFCRFGYLVGANRRVVSLRDFGEPEYHRVPVASSAELQAVAMLRRDSAWCVGRNGTVLVRSPGRPEWQERILPIPAGTRRLANFEAVAVRGERVCIAGGLVGCVFVSVDGGRTFALRPAPGPGPVHTVRYLSAPNGSVRLLAGGDGGRLWRSDDDGRTWRLLHGSDTTDVLFLLAAGDISVYPALVAHAAAGRSVAVVYAAVPLRGAEYPDAPAEIWLRAAAIAAGAGGAAVLNDFPSLASDAEDTPKSAEEILAAWSARLDAPAEPILLEQFSAAIRQYRPAILAVGPDAFAVSPQTTRDAENCLLSRLAQQAAARAAEENDGVLDRVGLRPHAVRRVFVGRPENVRYVPPWERERRTAANRSGVRIDGTAFPRSRKSSVFLEALEAIRQLGTTSPWERPARITEYLCRTEKIEGELFTRGLGTDFFPRREVSTEQKMLASGALLRTADVGGRMRTVLPDLQRAAEEKGTESLVPSLAAAEAMLEAWERLAEQGELAYAMRARDAFLRAGRSHPLYRMVNVLTLAMTCSAEYNAQWRRVNWDIPSTAALASRAAERFAAWHPWSDDSPGQMLRVRTMLATAPPLRVLRTKQEAMNILQRTARGAYPEEWKRLAAFEADCLAGMLRPPVGRVVLHAPPVTQPGRIDGRLDEKVWKKLPVVPLLPANGKRAASLAGYVQVFRTAGSLVMGLRLPAGVGRVWRVTLAADSDRDAWTQWQVEFDTAGGCTSRLVCRLAPAVKLSRFVGDGRSPDGPLFYLQAPRGPVKGMHVFELALPIHQAGVEPAAAGLWNFQICAAAEDSEGVRRIYLQPQHDPALRPERFALLEYPAMPMEESAGEGR